VGSGLSPPYDFLAGIFEETLEPGPFSLPISYGIASVGLIWPLSCYFQILSGDMFVFIQHNKLVFVRHDRLVSVHHKMLAMLEREG
jgi:hypothetical protein